MANSNPMSDLNNFREERFQSFSHSLRVFVFGVEISKWLKGEVSVTYGNRDSFNSLSLNLSNPRKIWQLTRENLRGTWRGTEAGEYDESGKKQIFRNKNENNTEISLDIIANGYMATRTNTTSGAQLSQTGDVVFNAPSAGNENKYRLAVNDCIINKHDPIRVFKKNPFSSFGSDQWVEIFCGFVQDHPITTNKLNGESTVRLQAQCIRQMLTKTRVQVNSLIHGNDPTPILNYGFFSDFAKGGIGTQAFANNSLERTIQELILGVRKDPNTSDPLAAGKTSRGVGQFQPGNMICYNPESPGNTLERWHLMTMFGVNKVGFPDLDSNLWLSGAEVKTIGESTLWSSTKQVAGPDGRYLHFLLPIGGTGAGTLTQNTIDNQHKEAEWTTRWEIIKDFASKLDFQVMTSPSGDILVEFPMYGFTPSSFSRNPPGAGQAFEGDDKTSFTGLESLFTLDQHLKEETLNDEGEDFPTVLQVTGAIAFQNVNTPTQNFRSFVFSPVLASRYGVIVEQADYPFAGQRASEADDQTVPQRLCKLGLIEFTKRMADASSWQGSLVYRPFLFPNRPFYIKGSARIGNLTSVSYSWNIGKDASCSIGINQLMAERYDGVSRRSSFRMLTGAVNTPISYRAIWSSKEPAVKESGGNSGASYDNKEPGEEGPDAPSTAGAKPESIPVPKRTIDKTGLFPPFAAQIEAIENSPDFASTGAVLQETLRSKERQSALPSETKAQSLLPYGLGALYTVKDKNAAEKLIGISNRVNTPALEARTFVGGPGFYKVEFSASRHWITPELAATIVGDGDAEAYKKVWTVITSKNGIVTDETKNAPVDSLSQREKALAGQTTDIANATNPGDCKQEVLEKSGGL